MADAVLAVKLNELDQKIGKLYGRIEIAGSSDHAQIRREAESLSIECMENKLAMRKKLKLSKARVLKRYSEVYDELEEIIGRAETELGLSETADTEDSLSADERILFAEYSLDFAMQAADHALLTALEAIDALMTEEEEEGGNR